MRLLHFLLYLVNSVSCSYLSLSQFMTNFHTVQVKKGEGAWGEGAWGEGTLGEGVCLLEECPGGSPPPWTLYPPVGGGNVGGGSVFTGGMSRRKSSSMDTISSCERSAISAKELYYAPLKSDRETCMR